MKDIQKVEVEAFLQQIIGLTVEDFKVVDQFSLAHYETQKTGRPLLRLGAADFSWLEKRVNDTVRPLHLAVTWPTSLAVISWTYVRGAAQAIIRRDRLSLEQYESNVGGFRLVGVVIPDHPSTAVEGNHV